MKKKQINKSVLNWKLKYALSWFEASERASKEVERILNMKQTKQ